MEIHSPFILFSNGFHCGEKENVADGGGIGEEHHKAIDTEAQASCGGQTILQGGDVIIIHLSVAIGLGGLLGGNLLPTKLLLGG